jgi:hypothetical protein
MIGVNMKLGVKRFLFLLCGVSSLAGCLTVGQEFSPDVRWIEKGKTRREEIDKRIGEPWRTGYDSGLYTYTYGFYRYSVFRPTRTRDLVVRFFQNGTVESYSFSSSFHEDKAAMQP